MASMKHVYICSQLGGDPDQLQGLLAQVNPTTAEQWAYVAGSMSQDVTQLRRMLADSAPAPLTPRNWTPSGEVVPAPYGGQWSDITPIPYGGPEGGFTYGAPLAARADGT